MTGLAVGARVERAPGDVGTVVEAESDRVRVQWDSPKGQRRPLEWLVLAMVRPESAPANTPTVEDLARAFAAAKFEWHKLYAQPEPPTREQRQAAHHKHRDAEFALLDAIIPEWRETYDFAWGEEQTMRRAAAEDAVAASAAEVSP